MLKMTSTDKLADISALKKRFLAINRERLERTRSALRERQRDFLDLLPLLFHANHPMLPGFVSKQTPVGVSDYSPGKRTLEVVKRYVRSFDYKRRALASYDIHSIFVMGSIGTVAYSDKSDIDIWLCHKPGIAPHLLEELAQKAQEVEKLAGQLDLEVHVFVMDAHSFKHGQHDDLSSESSGTAQHHLLLEEFYRTGLLLAGRYPVWWLVPPNEEAEYERYVYNLKHRRFIRDDECVDFGGIPNIPVEEFFGAALWQLSKGIDSPYKSVLKLLLIEAYAKEYPAVDLLCQRYKEAIFKGETNLNNLDPYIILYRKLEEYLSGAGETERVEMLRRCFYFKVNENLSVPDNPKYRTWQRELIMELAQSWHWDQNQLVMLDARHKWKIDQVSMERQVLVEQLTTSYQFLSGFARENSQLSLISQQDLNILGRKLYAAFERKAGKIEILNRGISEDLWESHLSIQQVSQRNTPDNWVLSRGTGLPNEIEGATPLKRSRSLVEILAWCHVNNMIDHSTVVTLNADSGEASTKEVREILRCLNRHFPLKGISGQDINALTKPPRVLKSAVFVNIGIDPLSTHTRQGKHLTTFRTDALSFGGLGENLAQTFDQIVWTSWNELLTFRHTGTDALMECLCAYLQWSPRLKGDRPTPLAAYSFSSSRGPTIAQRIEELFKDIITCFYQGDKPEGVRYIVLVKRHYYVVYHENGQFQFQRIESTEELIRYLATPRKIYSPVVIDRHALTDTPLPVINMTNRPGVIQLYYYLDGAKAHIYILDEHGSLFTQQQAYRDPGILLNQYTRFLKSVRQRQRVQLPVPKQSEAAEDFMSYYQIKKSSQHRWRLDRQEIVDMEAADKYLDVQVIGELAEDNKPIYTFYCDGREFTSLEYGPVLYEEVAMHILNRRHSGMTYPLYITDIDLPPALYGGGATTPLQAIHFLNYKKLIEDRMNEALVRLASAAVS
jgi:adenylate cyclase class 1